MIPFQRLLPEKKAEYDRFLKNCGQRGCEYSFDNLYLWGRQTAAIQDDCLLLFSHYHGYSVYPFPIGFGDLHRAVDAVIADSLERGIPCRFTTMARQDRDNLRAWYPGRFQFFSNRDDYDYVYAIDDLADLKGRKYQQKRTHLNHFEENFPDWEVKPLTPELLPEARTLADRWYRSHKAAEGDGNFRMEQVAMDRALAHYEPLELEGILLYAEGEPVAMAMGSSLTGDTFDVHFEKAMPDIPGGYAAVNREFARYLRSVHPALRYLNREDDLGIAGLRMAKQTYHPVYMVEKGCAWLEDEHDL